METRHGQHEKHLKSCKNIFCPVKLVWIPAPFVQDKWIIPFHLLSREVQLW